MEKKNELKEKLFYNAKGHYDKMTQAVKSAAVQFAEDYKLFLNNCKTERDCVEELSAQAEKRGFVRYTDGMNLKAGDKVYVSNRGKGLMLAVIGKKPPMNGLSILAAHIDSPRIDLKPVPLFEDTNICMFKTHYYGGIKKYQWTTIPLELRGVIVRKDGTKIKISVGNKPEDPVFTITDLLPHLAREQMKKTMNEGIEGENLNVLAGSLPYEDDKDTDERVKLAVLKLLNEQFGIIEEDFLSAELCFVPAWGARDVGFDRSMIGAYGHDDKVCAYASFKALCDVENPEYTSICLLADKEEIGSEGISGMKSAAFEEFIYNVCGLKDEHIEKCFGKSICLSADVTNAYDPTYGSVCELKNTAYLGEGLGICKYTGGGGKYDTSDASAELMWEIRNILDNADVAWQTGELGKVDIGGGGTVAMYLANRNINVVDAGVPVLCMHSPFEVISKLDLYQSYRGYLAFLERKESKLFD